MKIYLVLLLLLSVNCLGGGYPSCNYHETREVPLIIDGKKAELEVTLKDKFCYAAKIKIKIVAANKVVYSYTGDFEPRSGIGWQQMTTADARHHFESVFDSDNFIKCSDMLPSVLPAETYYDYNTLLIPIQEYEQYRASNCTVFINRVHYEYSQYVVFPVGQKHGVVVSEFGI